MEKLLKTEIGGRTLKLPQGTLDVGRMADCWLTLDDDLTSRYHARFHVGAGGVELRATTGAGAGQIRIESRLSVYRTLKAMPTRHQ